MIRRPSISIVVCSYNGENTLADCLEALKNQDWHGKIEIIIVDDGSTDDTYQIAKSFQGVRVIHNQTNLGLAASRNVGIKNAHSPIIAFTDDDCVPPKHWVKQIYAGYSTYKILGVGGAMLPADNSTFMSRYLSMNNPLEVLEYSYLSVKGIGHRFGMYLKVIAGLNSRKTNRKRYVYSLLGGNMSFRKKTLTEVGMFDEAFTFGGEDQELCRRINKLYPKSLYFLPRAKLKHQFDTHLSDTIRRSKSYAIGNARMNRKHNDLSHTVYPFPVFIVLTLLLGLITPWLLLTPLVLTQLIYPKGLKQAVKTFKLEALLYSYIQVSQEVANNYGYLIGLWKYRKTFKHPVNKESDFLADGVVVGTMSPQPRRKLLKPYRDGAIISIMLLATLLSNLVKSSTVFHLPAAILIILVSGYILFRGLGGYQKTRLDWMLRLSLITALGIFYLMVLGLLVDVILPLFHISHPLTSNWLYAIFPVATAALLPWSLRQEVINKPKSRARFGWERFVILDLIVATLALSFVGARLLNNNYTNIPALAAFGVGFMSIIFAVIKYKKLPEYALPLTIFAVSLASVWSYSLRSNYVFGFDIQQEFQVFQTTLSAGKWLLGAYHGPYDAMLSLTVFPVLLTKLSNISGLTIFKVIAPMIFSLVPVTLYYIYRQFTRNWISFIASLVVVAQFYYMQQFSGEVRQQIAFLFFACILYVILQKNKLSSFAKNSVLLVFLLGLVVSHYSTTFLAIILLAGTYLATKILILVRGRSHKRRSIAKKAYIKGWTVLVLCIGALLWYVPATHSYGNLQSFNETITFSHVLSSVYDDVVSFSKPSRVAPLTTQLYLNDISKYYRESPIDLTYYQSATNNGVTPMKVPVIKSKSKALSAVNNGLTILFNYGWWLLGTIAIGVVFVWAYLKRQFKYVELAITGGIGIMAFTIIHVSPSLQTVYNASRLNEQVLMVVSLPAILLIVWLLERIWRQGTRSIVAVTIGIAFLLASGVVTQFVGGNPAANLNNYGVDYDSLYAQQTDIAAAQWLGTQYHSDDSVFADDYASLKLEAASNVSHGEFLDVTPATVAEGSFVYADYNNVKNGITTSSVNGTNYSYSYPSSFLDQNKDLVYNSGDSEIYK
jgi:uncharacterized membrane protein/glycosyltransferase involved in cell wall biosynthesis